MGVISWCSKNKDKSAEPYGLLKENKKEIQT
jgi:hypothetical protein